MGEHSWLWTCESPEHVDQRHVPVVLGNRLCLAWRLVRYEICHWIDRENTHRRGEYSLTI
jgi:hypothetical protein